MKAAVFHAHPGPEFLRLEEVPPPTLGPGEAIVKVHTVSLNAFDLMARAGRYRPNRTFPHILGSDFAGEVAEIDERAGVPFRAGQRVTAWWVAPCGRCEQCMGGHPIPLAAAADAHRHLAGRQQFGKVVLSVAH